MNFPFLIFDSLDGARDKSAQEKFFGLTGIVRLVVFGRIYKGREGAKARATFLIGPSAAVGMTAHEKSRF